MKIKKKPGSKSVKPGKIVLPTQKSVIAQGPKDYILMFYGPPGIGKTTFVDELSPRVLFLSTDRGTRFMSAMRVEISSMAKLEAVLTELEKPGSTQNYDMICIDHVDDLCRMVEDSVLKRLGIESLGDAAYGKGWRANSQKLHHVIARLKRLNLGLIFISHEQVKTIRARGMETERTMPDIPKSAWKVIIPIADLVGYMGFKRVKVQGGKSKEIRTIQTRPEESLYAKDRTRRKKPENGWEPLKGSEFIKTFSPIAPSK